MQPKANQMDKNSSIERSMEKFEENIEFSYFEWIRKMFSNTRDHKTSTSTKQRHMVSIGKRTSYKRVKDLYFTISQWIHFTDWVNFAIISANNTPAFFLIFILRCSYLFLHPARNKINLVFRAPECIRTINWNHCCCV